jgi:hypothetical protein
LRREAEARQARAEELSEISEDESQRAREQRTVAEKTVRQAQSVDPHADALDDDFDLEEVLGSEKELPGDRRSEPLSDDSDEREDVSAS